MKTDCDIAVVGAGPVGLAATALLVDAGYSVTLLAPPAPPDRRTTALLGSSIDLLKRLRVWDRVAADAAPLRIMRIVDGTSRLIRSPEVAFDAREIGLPAFGYNIPNAVIVAALEAAVAERDVRRVAAFASDITPAADSIAIGTASGETVVARLAVAADGRKSRVRDAAGIAAEEWSYPQAALVCNLAHSEAHYDTSTEFHTEGGPFTLVPLPGDRRSSLVWVDRPDDTRRRLALDDVALAAEIEERSGAILGAITVASPRQSFPMAGMSVRRFAASRVMLVGEAAHVFPPIGAQGLNLGYRDVAALAEVLAGPRTDPGAADALDAFDRARRVDTMSRTAAVDALNRSLLSPFLPVQAFRGLGLYAIDRINTLRHLAMRQGLAS